MVRRLGIRFFGPRKGRGEQSEPALSIRRSRKGTVPKRADADKGKDPDPSAGRRLAERPTTATEPVALQFGTQKRLCKCLLSTFFELKPVPEHLTYVEGELGI